MKHTLPRLPGGTYLIDKFITPRWSTPLTAERLWNRKTYDWLNKGLCKHSKASSFWVQRKGTNGQTLILHGLGQPVLRAAPFFVALFSNSVPQNQRPEDSEQGCPSRHVHLDIIKHLSSERQMSFIIWKGISNQTSEPRSMQEALQASQKVAPEYLPLKACSAATPSTLLFLRDGLYMSTEREAKSCQSFFWLVSDHIYESVSTDQSPNKTWESLCSEHQILH